MHFQAVLPFLAVLTVLSVKPANSETCDVTSLKEGTNLEDCLSQVKAGALALDKTVLTASDTFSVYIDAVFCAPNRKIQACCDVICGESGSERLNPLKGDKPKSYKLFEKPHLKFYSEPGANVAVGDSQRYALMLLDLENSWIHWLQMDLDGLKGGKEVIPFFTPVIGRIDHLLILFRQPKAYADNIDNYAKSKDTMPDERFRAFCSEVPRCAFDYAGFVQEYGLEVLGATWISPSDTNYTLVMRKERLGFTKEAACGDQLVDGSCPAPEATIDNTQCDFKESDDDEDECKDAYNKADFKGKEPLKTEWADGRSETNGVRGQSSVLWGLGFLALLVSRYAV